MRLFLKVSILTLLILGGCSPSSLEDFHHEGEALCRDLVTDLKKIHHRDDLAKAVPLLKKRFDALVDLMIEARHFQKKHPEEFLGDDKVFDDAYSQTLAEELKRIYALEGGREQIEKAQREALIRLDAFERESTKQNQLRPK